MKQKAILSILCLVGGLFFLISFIEEDKTFIERTPHNAITNPYKLSGITDTYRSDSSRLDNFVPQGDGTVVDKRTGLQWMRCSLGQKWTTGKTCLGEPSNYHWQDALNQSPKFAGYNDWRLPNKAELETLVYCRTGHDNGRRSSDWLMRACKGESRSPSISKKAFPATPPYVFWSSSPYAFNNFYAWAVSFDNGSDYYGSKYIYSRVRLVRGGQ